MRKTVLLFLSSLLAAAELSAGAGIASDASPSPVKSDNLTAPSQREKNLALFMSALLEKNPQKQCLKLLEVIEADPANAATPLAAFSTSFRKLRNGRKVLDRFNALWKRFPADTNFVIHGSELNRFCSTAPSVRLQQLEAILKTVPARLCSRKEWEPNFTAILLHNTADAILRSGQYSRLLILFRQWQSAPAPHRLAAQLNLAPACHTAAARLFCAGKNKEGKNVEKCFLQAVAGIKAAEASVKTEQEAWEILVFYRKFHKILSREELRFVQQFYGRFRSNTVNIWRLTTAADCGNIEIFNQAAAKINEYNPRFNPTELRFRTLLNGKHFLQAEKELKRLPEKHHFELMTQLLTRKRDWKKLAELLQLRLSKGTPPDFHIGVLLLSAAEKLHDTALYQQGKKILLPSSKIPAVANTIGYVGAVLDQDLPQGRQLLAHALKKEPMNIAYLDSMAWIAFKQKRFKEAEKWLRKALLNVQPREGIAVILEHAGDVAAALGKDPRPFYRLSLKYAPFDDEFDKESVLKKIKAGK